MIAVMKILQLLSVLLLSCLNLSSFASEPDIDAGGYFSLAVNSQGQVYWWGNEYGKQYFESKEQRIFAPELVQGLPPAERVAAGTWHAAALTRDGAVYEWGYTPNAMRRVYRLWPTLGPCELLRIASGGHGKDPCGDLKFKRAAQTYVAKPEKVGGIPAMRVVAAGESVTMAISRDGHLYCWSSATAPTRIDALQDIKAVRLGQFHALALRADGTVFSWGSNHAGQLGRASPKPDNTSDQQCGAAKPEPVMDGAIDIAAAKDSSFALKQDGTVWGWGDNTGHKINLESTSLIDKITEPRLVTTQNGATALGTAWWLAYAWDADGSLYAWGMRNELGTGLDGFKAPYYSAPVRVPLEGKVRKVSSGLSVVLALMEDGALCAWGDNSYGQIRPGLKDSKVRAPMPIMAAGSELPLRLAVSEAAATNACAITPAP